MDRLSTDPRIKNLTTFVAMMSVLRCISFGMEYCWRARENLKDKQSSLYSLLDLLVFNFYLPVFVNGPVITFDTFQKTVSYFRWQCLSGRPFCSAIVWSRVRDLLEHSILFSFSEYRRTENAEKSDTLSPKYRAVEMERETEKQQECDRDKSLTGKSRGPARLT